jgi:DNA-directed RNA polymerase specialized sigma24 family protein
MRHGEGKEEARELYVYQQMTFEEIAARVGRTEKTVRSWAEAEGWKQARREMISMRSGTVEKLQTLVDKVADRMIRDCDDAEELSPQSLHALTNLVTAIKNYYTYDSKAKVDEQALTPPEAAATPEEIAERVAAIMGA